MTFSFDHHGFYHEGKIFRPQCSGSGQNVAVVKLPASLSDDLNWEAALLEAQKYICEGYYILWELDLGLDSVVISPQDSGAFFSHSLAVEEFAKKVFFPFKEKTFAVCVYRGSSAFENGFPLHVWESRFQEWLQSSSSADYRLFSAQILSEYLHRLLSFLPDEAIPLAFIDVADVSSSAALAQLLSRERFEHLMAVPCKDGVPQFPVKEECSVGVCLPMDSHIDFSVLQQLDQLFLDLEVEGKPWRIVCEAKLTEEWDGLDEIHTLTGSVSVQGKRKLSGFMAAGGIVRDC